jgi:hypothetical protein
MDQMPSVPSRAVRLLDLSSGASRDLSAAPAGWHAWNPSISGTMVAWIDWRYEEPNDTGALDWRIEVQDVRQDGGAARTVASGASWPALDLDGDRLVYAVEDEAGASDGWKVVVQALAGPIADTLRTSEPVFDLAASGGAVAWTQGPIDPVVGYTTDTTLYVARGSPLVATRVASDAYDLALEDGRVAWTQDTPGGRGAAVGSRIWSADVATLTAQPVSPPPGGGTEQRQEWPATGDGIVTWGSSRLSLADPSVNGDRLAAWTPALGRAVELLPSEGAILSGVNGGWVVWVDGRTEPQTVSGATEQSVGLP